KAEIDESGTQIEALLAGEGEEGQALLRQMQERLKAYAAAVEPVTHQLETGGYETATIANRMLGRAHEQHKALMALLGQVEQALGAEVAALGAESQAANRQTLLVFGVA